MAEINTIYVHGIIGVDVTSDMVIPIIDKAIADKAPKITVDVSSQGGGVDTGREIMGAMERAKMAGITVETRCLSYAYSMGAMIFASGSKGHRSVSEFAELMFHKANGGVQGTITEIERYLTMLKDMSKNLFTYLVKDNDSNKSEIENAFENETMIGATDAIRLGLADGYVEKLQAVAFLENKIDMKKENIEEAKGLLTAIKEGFDSIRAMFKHKDEVKNLATETPNGTLHSEGSLSVGSKVYSDAEMTTPASDGTYGDYTVSGGEVTAIASEATDSVEDLTAKITDLTTQLNAIKAEKLEAENKIAAAELEKVENKKVIDAMMLKVEELGKVVLGEEGRHQDDDKTNTPVVETMSMKMKRLDAENKAKYLNIN